MTLAPCRLRALAVGGVLAALTSCGQPAGDPSGARYTVGPAWQGALGVWFYPSAHFTADQNGLAAIADDDHPDRTADGEMFDQRKLAAAHQTLQLPAIVRVTNLENGRQLLVRVNDRGPRSPGRVIELTRHAADLLGVAPGSQVRLQVQEAVSRRLAETLQAGQPSPQPIDPAPVDPVQEKDLEPPTGIARAPARRIAAGPQPPPADPPAAAEVTTDLPDAVTQGTPYHGRLLIRAGDFGRLEFAERVQAKLTGLPARIERTRIGRTESYRVAIGPFNSVAAADAALDQALKGGVTDARIVVE